MLSKENRLKKTEFKKVFTQGKRLYSPFFTIIYISNRNTNVPQCAVVVSKKIDKRASMRNRIKRRVREALRRSLKNISPHVQCIFLCKSLISTLTVEEIEQEVLKYIQRMV